MEWSNDVGFAQETWNSWVSAVDWLVSFRSNSTGLINLSTFQTAFLGPPTGSAVNTAAVRAFQGMASAAAAVNDNRSHRKWTNLAKTLTKAINTVLWNDEAGVYSIHPSDNANFSIAALGFAITSGIASNNQARRSVAQLPQVQLGPGYRDSTTANASNPSTNLSPNVNGFLLPGLLQQKQAGSARFLLENL
ncbi:Six-hairpin glycosidase-like protein [Aspergillus falconensis]